MFSKCGLKNRAFRGLRGGVLFPCGLFLLMGMVLPSCQSFSKKKSFFPHNLRSLKEGIFKGDVVVKLRSRKATPRLKAEITLLPSEGARVDLTAVLNLPVLTLRFKKAEVLALFFQSRQYYRGKNQFPAVFPLSLSLLKEVLFDRSPSPDWLCQVDFRQKPLHCKKGESQIVWKRNPGLRTLIFQNKDHQVAFYLSEFTPVVLKDVFDLQVPPHFKALQKPFLQSLTP